MLRSIGKAFTGTLQRVECAVTIVPFYLSCLAIFGTSQEEAVRGMVLKWVDLETDLMRDWDLDKVEVQELLCICLAMGIVRAEELEDWVYHLRQSMVKNLKHEASVLECMRSHRYDISIADGEEVT